MKTAFLYRYIIKWLFDWAAYQGGEEVKDGREALISNLYLISHRRYDVEKLTVRGSINLNLGYSGAKQNVLCKKKSKKNVLHFVLLN